MRLAASILALIVAGCGQRVSPPAITGAQLATVERAVTYCTAATAKLTPAISKGDRTAISYAAIDARNRCSEARKAIAEVATIASELAVCQKDVDAQEGVGAAQLSVIDGTTAERRRAVVTALDNAISLQGECGRAVERLKGADGEPGKR